MPFHNTIQAEPQLMIVYNADAITGEDAVLEVMKKVKRAAWFQVQGCLEWMNEDSLKRSLSNLSNPKRYDKGAPLRMDTDKGNMVMGPNGKRCHQYVLNDC